MISQALSFLSNYINKELKLSFGLTEDKVQASSLINPDGSVTDNIENKIKLKIVD